MEMEKGKLAKKEICDDPLRTTGGMSYHIPFDLIPGILKGLPVKALARSLCVSKDIALIIRHRDFMKSYLIKSSTRASTLFFTFKSYNLDKHVFLSAIQPKKRGSSSSSYCSRATYHVNCDSRPYATISPSVHGLICYGPPSKLMVYNPSTGKNITLPKFFAYSIFRHNYIGYDPVNGDYKVLCMTGRLDGLVQNLFVLTLGDGNSSWREIQDFPTHYRSQGRPGFPASPDVCVNGVLHYAALVHNKPFIVCFDVRFERFDLIKVPGDAVVLNLTSYEGKLAVLYSHRSDKGRICLCVLEDAAKQEWSIKSYVLPRDVGKKMPCCATHEGEIVLAATETSAKQFCLVYYDPNKDTVRTVHIEMKIPLRGVESELTLASIVSGQVDTPLFL